MMEPSVLSEHLRKLAGLIDRSEAPNLKIIRAELREIVSNIEGGSPEPRQAAKLKKFMNKDFESAVDGLDNLIKELSKITKTLNPQEEESKAVIESSLNQLHTLKSTLTGSIESLEPLDI